MHRARPAFSILSFEHRARPCGAEALFLAVLNGSPNYLAHRSRARSIDFGKTCAACGAPRDVTGLGCWEQSGRTRWTRVMTDFLVYLPLHSLGLRMHGTRARCNTMSSIVHISSYYRLGTVLCRVPNIHTCRHRCHRSICRVFYLSISRSMYRVLWGIARGMHHGCHYDSHLWGQCRPEPVVCSNTKLLRLESETAAKTIHDCRHFRLYQQVTSSCSSCNCRAASPRSCQRLQLHRICISLDIAAGEIVQVKCTMVRGGFESGATCSPGFR